MSELRPDVPVRDAATVVLLRDGADGLAVWMLTRVRQMAFAGGVAVFPGGRLDEADGELPLLPGAAVQRAAARFECGERFAHALLGAAVREMFEETGVLLSEPHVDLSAHRGEVEAGRLPFGELLAEHGVMLDANGLLPWARWVTPAGERRRYDTRFFVGALPPGAQPANVTTESSTAGWVGVADAVVQAQRGERALMPPTLITLTDLSRYDTVGAVLAAAGDRVIDTVRPELTRDEDGRPRVVHNGVALPLPRLPG